MIDSKESKLFMFSVIVVAFTKYAVSKKTGKYKGGYFFFDNFKAKENKLPDQITQNV